MIVVALFTALIAPYFIDWTAYKTDFERQASRILGQKVRVDGQADVRILPLPSISFSKLSVGQNASNQPMMTVERFSANVELMPFLSGEVRIVDMALDNPVFNLEIDDGGKIAWTERQEILVDPDQVKLDRLKITNAGFNIKGISADRIISGENINADVSALSLYGPWTISGEGLIDGQKGKFEIGTGRLSDDQSLRLKTKMVRLDKPYELAADGVVTLKDNVLSWGGKFDITPLTNTASRADLLLDTPLPVSVSGDFVLNPTELSLPEFRIDIGSKDDPYSLAGSGMAVLKGGIDFRLQIDGRQIDINRVAKMREGESAVANSMEERLELFGKILQQVPVPSFKGEIDFEIPAIIAGDTFIREISTVVRPFGNDWEIVRFKSSFPGNTLVEANGRLSSGETFGFHGDLLIASTQPSGFAAWAAGEVDPAIRKLSSAGLSAQVTLTREQINLEQMELILDDNRLTGSLRRLRPVQSIGASTSSDAVFLPAIVADLTGDNVRLEDMRAIATLIAGEDSVTLNNDFDVTLQAKNLSGFKLDASDVELQFQYKNGELSISRLNAKDFLGANLKSTGQIANILDQSKGNITVDLSSGSLAVMANEFGERLGWNPAIRTLASNPILSQDTNLKMVLDSNSADDDVGQSRFLVSGQMGGTNIALRGGFKGSLVQQSDVWIEASLEADNANGSVLLRQLGLGEAGFDPIYGELETPLNLVLETVGSNAQGFSTIVSANTQDAAFSARGLVKDLDKDVPSLDFDITLGAWNISPFVTSFGYFLPELNDILGDVAPLSTKFKWQSDTGNPGSVKIEKGQIYGNSFTGNFSRLVNEAGAVSFDGDFDLDKANLDILFALATGGYFTNESGNWADTEFSFPPFKGTSGKFNITAGSFEIGLQEKAEGLKLDLVLNDGDFSVASFGAKWLGADISGSGAFTNSEGATALNGQFTFLDLKNEAVLINLGAAPVLTGVGNIVGTLEAAGNSPLALIRSMVGSGIVEIKQGRIEGVGNNSIEPMIEAADVEDFDINTETVAPLIEEIFTDGSLDIADVQAPFSLANGALQFRNVSLSGAQKGARILPVVDLEVDIVEGGQKTEIRLFPDPGKEKVSGGNPDLRLIWNGSLNKAELTIDSAAMEGYLSIRSFENEQRRVETLQASILEKQRFRYELLKSRSRDQWIFAKQQEEVRLAKEAADRVAKEEAERLAREEAQRVAEEEARKEAERLAREEEERLRLETERLLQAEEAERLKKEEEAKAAEREKQRLAEEQEKARKAAEEQARIEAENARLNTQAAKKAEEQKSGFEIKSLSDPSQSNAPDIFRNIEDLLKAQ